MPTISPQSTPYYGGGQVINPANVIQTSGPPSTHIIQQGLGTIAVDNATGTIYGLASKSGGSATWAVLGGGSGAVATLTGNSGGAVSPTGGNINILGSGVLAFAGSGSTLTGTITPGTTLVSTIAGNTGGARSPTAGAMSIVGTGDVSVSGSASTLTIAVTPSTGIVSTLTGNSGGAISPTSGNINILGGSLSNFVGSGSTLTLTPKSSAWPDTPYVVGPVGSAGYQTIQSAVNAANSAGGGMVIVQPGTYTENLTLYDKVNITGLTFADTGGGVTIVGVHTPPTSGGFAFDYVALNSATHIFNSNAAGSAHLVIGNSIITVTNGYTFNLPNWTGKLETYDVNDRPSTNDGYVNNTGGSEIAIFSCAIGSGTVNPMIVSGVVSIFTCAVGCPINFVTGSNAFLEYNVHTKNISFLNNSTGEIIGSEINSQITMSSSAGWLISQCTINTSSSPAIDGSGSGTLTLGDLTFVNNSTIAGTLTTAWSSTSTGALTVTGSLSSTGSTTLATTGSTVNTFGSTTGTTSSTISSGSGGITLNASNATVAVTSGTGTVNISSDATANSVNLATGAGVKTLVLGSTNSTSVSTLQSGTGGLNISSNNGTMNITSGTGTINIGADATANSINLATGAAAKTLIIGSSTAGSSTVINGSSSGFSLAGTTTMTINCTSTSTVNMFNGAAQCTLGIASGAGVKLVTLGSTNTTSSTTIQSGSGGISITSTNSALSVNSGTGTLSISNDSSATTLNIGTGSAAKTTTLGSTNTTSATTVQSGSGGITLTGETTLGSGNFIINTAAKQLRVHGGAATDFIGQATLTNGTVTVSNTNIATTDRVFIQRSAKNASTAYGVFQVTITASTNFVITSCKSDTTTETGDASTVDYFIVRQV